jgi:heme A synthase
VAEGRQGLQLARRVAAGIATVLVLVLVVQAWRQRPRSIPIRYTAAVMGTLFLAEILVGGLMLLSEPGLGLQIVHAALAAGFWATLVALVVLLGLARAVRE